MGCDGEEVAACGGTDMVNHPCSMDATCITYSWLNSPMTSYFPDEEAVPESLIIHP